MRCGIHLTSQRIVISVNLELRLCDPALCWLQSEERCSYWRRLLQSGSEFQLKERIGTTNVEDREIRRRRI
jgi:hypothetical protein